MKLRELYANFQTLKTIYDKCSYDRIFQLLDAFNEVEDRVKKVEEKRSEIAKKYGLDQEDPRQKPNPRKKENATQEEIDQYDKAVAERQESERKANEEFAQMLDADTHLKKNLRFTKKDVDGSGITGSQVMTLYNLGFIAKSGNSKNKQKNET